MIATRPYNQTQSELYPSGEVVANLDDLPAITATGVLTAANFDVTIHDATITIKNPATGNHRTFSIRTVPATGRGGRASAFAGKRIVSLLIGPDNFQGFGFADSHGVHVWAKMRYAKGGLDASVYEAFARMLENPRKWAARGVEYWIAGRCVCCGKVLTHPSSVADSMGPVCRGKMGG